MSHFADRHRVFVIEEPIMDAGSTRLDLRQPEPKLFIATPHIGVGTPAEAVEHTVARFLQGLVAEWKIDDAIHWFYTPMMLGLTDGMSPAAVVYDCMDELSAFRGAPPEMLEKEAALLKRADVVFTGGRSLYEAKRDRHPNVHAFPSSVDVSHFQQSLEIADEYPEQAALPHPRVGYVGVIDERLDTDLVGRLAELRPDLNIVMVGPVVKISEDDLPRRENIHYLGMRSYDELPAILAGWDVALMPFALNEATRFISPTKTPEYLAAGLPVVSTAIADVVDPYGTKGLVHIAATAEEFSAAIDKARREDRAERMSAAADHLSESSWERTYQAMSALLASAVEARRVSMTGGSAFAHAV